MFNLKSRALAGATLALLAATSFSSAATAQNGTNPKAMTWGTYNLRWTPGVPTPQVAAQRLAWKALAMAHPNVVVVGCNTVNCDAYTGDTAETETRPIMCFVPGTIPEPSQYEAVFSGGNYSATASSDWHFYFGWSGGQIGLSKPVLGTAITSQAAGDAICKEDPNDLTKPVGMRRGLGDPTAQMIEHHVNKVGGWGAGGMIHPKSQYKYLLLPSHINQDPFLPLPNKIKPKFWASINGQPSNPWN